MAVASPSVSGVGGHDDLLHAPGGHPLHQGFDMQVVGPHVVHGGDDPVEHVVEPLVLPGALHGHHVLGVGHHADGGGVPPWDWGRWGRGRPLGQVLAHGQQWMVDLAVQDGLGKGGRLLLGRDST